MTGKYESHVANRLEVIKGWCRDGLIEEEIAKRLGVSYSSLNKYKKEHSELSQALKEGKEVADYRVENALYQKALSGDTTAIIFWLKNRRAKQWRDKQEIDHSHEFHIKVDLVDDEHEES
jgi:transposase